MDAFPETTSPIEFLQDDLLPSLRPATTDAKYLDRLSAEQLVDFTYRSGVRSDEVGEGNCLVPTDVGGFEDARFRNPPAHRVSFLVKRESLGTNLSLTFEGFIGSYLDVDARNRYDLSADDLPSVQIGNDSYDIYTGERPFRTSARPLKFRVESSDIELELDRSFNESQRFPGNRTTVARTNPTTGVSTARRVKPNGVEDGRLNDVTGTTAEVVYDRPELELEFSVGVNEDLRSLGGDEHEKDYVRVVILVRNITPVNESNPSEWVERRVFFPSLRINFEEAEVAFPSQQHDIKLEEAISSSGIEGDDEPIVYGQQDCILTREVAEHSQRWESRGGLIHGGDFQTTSFGVYDYVEEEPVNAQYRIDELVQLDDSELIAAMDLLSDRSDDLLEHDSLLNNLRAVLLTLRYYLNDKLPPIQSDEYYESDLANDEPTLRKFQWDSLQRRAESILDKETNPVVVQAPTSSGKTVVYYGSTMLSVFEWGTRAAFPFPTRMLTEDKLEEVIELAFAYEENVRGGAKNLSFDSPDQQFSVGVALGSGYGDPLHARDLVDYIGTCDRCGSDLTTKCQDCDSTYGCNDDMHLHFVRCRANSCGFEYDFVYDVERTPQYLPSLTVGTPEKFFTMPTIETGRGHSTFSKLPFYGAPHKKCEQCERALSDMNIYRVANDRDGLNCRVCQLNDHVRTPVNQVDWTVRRPETGDPEFSPIGHIVLDETHMYTGQFGITISIILRFFEVLASRLRTGEDRNREAHDISVDSGTATISNKIEHISKLLRADRQRIHAVPDSGEHGEYFNVRRNRVRYRVLAATPVASSNRGSFREAVVQTYDDFHNDSSGTEFRAEFNGLITDTLGTGSDIDEYDLILGYLHRKSDGYALRESIGDRAQQISDGGLDDLQFISGDSSKSHLREHIGMGESRPDPVVLANLVVSLGIDIDELNNLLLFGAPRSMSEQMQTIGRTGRDEVAGHAGIHLYPEKPRDKQIERRFHQILGNIDDYYDRAAIQPTNPHIAEILFEYVLGPFMTLEFAIGEECANPRKPQTLQDLMKMFDETDNPSGNEHAIALFYDLQSVFCPSDLGMDDLILRVIEDQITDNLFDYIGDEENNSKWFTEAMQNRSENEVTYIDSWFSRQAGDLELRGEEQTRIDMKTEWSIPSEVNN